MYKTWNTQRPRIMWATACLALLGACTDNPMAPVFLYDATSADVASLGDSVFVPNARKYADAGLKPVRGRSGGASMSAWALLARDGSAQIEVAAGDWNGWTRNRRMHDFPVGDARLRSVQLKVFQPDGEALYTTNTHQISARTATLSARGLVNGGRARVQGIIERTSSGARVGVVTMDVPVVLRPDLAVSAVQAEPQATEKTSVTIGGIVRELNGQLGAWADCVLYVDGMETDRAHGIWVDAGGTVSCVFSHTFATPGTRQLEVRVADAAPGDYEPSNNAAKKSIDILSRPTTSPSPFTFTAGFDDVTSVTVEEREDSWLSSDGLRGGEGFTRDTSINRSQSSYLRATMPRAVRFPLAELSARQFTSVETVHSASYANVDADWTYDDGSVAQSCVRRGHEDPALGRAWLYVCAYDFRNADGTSSELTTVEYDRGAGAVTFVSRGWWRDWNRSTGLDESYTWNNPQHDPTGILARYGQDYSFALQVTDASGPNAVNSVVPLFTFTSSSEIPRSCRTWQDAFTSSTSCSTYWLAENAVSGFASGAPTP